MSKENVELCERAIAFLNARATSDEIAEEILAPGYRIENTQTAVTDKTYYGAEGAREWIADFLSAFKPGAQYEIEENIADGDDFVVALVRLVGQGAHSGAPLVLRWVTVTWIRDAKMTRAVGYLSRSEALKAVGLEK